MYKGLRTAKYAVTDLGTAKAWYSRLFGKEPYFDEPFYVGFNVGGYELGLVPASDEEPAGIGGNVAYWGIEDVHKAWDALIVAGARSHSEITDVGGGILIGSVLDPFGNEFRIIYNPHFKLEE